MTTPRLFSGRSQRISFSMRFSALFAIALVWCATLTAGPARESLVTFELRLPYELAADARLFIAGNHPALGDWNPGAVEVPRTGNRANWTVALPEGCSLEYKFTLGTWDGVEVAVDNMDITNRALLVPPGKTTVRIAIPKFKSPRWDGTRRSTLTGDVRLHEGFASRHVASRTLWVYLPPGYESDTKCRYPVIYVQDGNNCFDEATSFDNAEWGVDETFETLIPKGRLPKAIVVGIANSPDRMDEYTMVRQVLEEGYVRVGGKADAYAAFLIGELKPFIDGTYRTLPDARHTAVMGSALGGLFSLYAGIRHPKVFGTVGAVSPLLHWGNHWMTNYVRSHPRLDKNLRIWIDTGTAEDPKDQDRNGVPDLVDDVHDLCGALLAKGFDRERLGSLIDEGAKHHETAWARRLPQILEFICRPWLIEK